MTAGAATPIHPGIDALIKAYVEARSLREEADGRVKQLKATEVRAEADLFDAMERVGLRSARTEELGTFILSDLAWAKVVDEDKARAWAEAEMPELLLLNRQRLSVLVRRHLKGEGDIPPGVDFTTTRSINWRKPGKDE